MPNESQQKVKDESRAPRTRRVKVTLTTHITLPTAGAFKSFDADLDDARGVLSGLVRGKLVEMSVHSQCVMAWQPLD